MSADTLVQSDAHAEQAGKDISPFSLTARMKPKRLTGKKKKTDGKSEKSVQNSFYSASVGCPKVDFLFTF